MALTKEQKEEVVKDLRKKIDKQQSITFINFEGLKVDQLTALRKKIKELGGELKVAKKTLIKLAFERAGLKLKEFEGQLGLIFAFKDKFKPLKETYNFSQENKSLQIVGGLFGKEFVKKKRIIEIAQLPSRKELLRRVSFGIGSPLSGLVNVFQTNIKGLVYTLNQVKNKKS